MKEFKGTPGPWQAVKHYSDSTEVMDANGFSHVSAEGCAILLGWAEKGFEHWGDSDEAHRYLGQQEQEANANLIAAAPDLLEALQKMFRAGQKQNWNERYESEMNAARAAISKALGEE